MLAYTSAPYTIIMPQETHPMLQSSTHPRSFDNSKNKGQHWFLFFITKLSSFLGIAAIVMSLVWFSIIMLDDKPIRNTYETTTFLTTIDKTNVDSWQVLTQSWSELSKPNPATDVKFNHYFECWHAAGIAATACSNSSVSDYKTCLTAKYSTQLNLCAANNDEARYSSPTLNEYSTCVNSYFAPDRASSNAFEICLRTNQWPLYESPEPTDSWFFLGSFNWILILTVGFGLFSCFVLYTGGFVINAESLDVSESGKVGKNGPLSYSITGACAALSFLFFLYFLVNAYKTGGTSSKYLFPNSIATNNIMIPATVIVFVYFLMEFLEMWNPADVQHMVSKVVHGGQMLQAPNMPKNHNLYDGNDDARSWRNTVTNYFPALTMAWADGYMVDPLLVVGLLGATHQLNTAVLYQIFMAVFTYRMANTSLARFMYEGYIYNPDEANGKFTKERGMVRDELYAVRMQAMFMQLSGTMALVMLWYILTNDNIMLSEYTLVYLMLYLWFIVPEIVRLVAHVIVAFQALGTSDKYVLMTSNYFLWIWDVLVRLIFIIIVIWGANTIPGTQYFVDVRLQNITDTVLFAVY